jgi:hypothetical protein
MPTLLIIFEYNGSDVATVAFVELISAGQLLAIAWEIAHAKETDVNEITMRFAMKGESHEYDAKAQAVH